MRDIINKGLTNEELWRGIKTAYEQGWNKVKLYFMIGLPGETDADVIGIAETVHWLQQECRTLGGKRLEVTLTISNFTPKPHTPFQWHSVSTAEFLRKQDLLRQEFRRMRGVKANFTDVRISAMEDFVGRGDRRLAPVVRRAWELGAGMDSWWESLDRAFGAWTQAIAESDLSWKYRQVESGEWNVMDGTGTDLDARLDAPLPWDVLDTGIDKNWLKEDLKLALAAATVPDCSFEGCSHCGVCGVDFGHNIVVAPLPIPAFAGHFSPNSDRVQRLRLWMGKMGDMALVSHLDLLRLFDRAVRRADLPISFTGGYHPGPRIAPANALTLGYTSESEIVDFELTELMDPEEFRERLSAQLPADLPIYRIEPVAVKAPSASQLLDQAEYILRLGLTPSSDPEVAVQRSDWQQWISEILAAEDIEWEHTTKKGKVKWVNLRDRLFELEPVEVSTDALTCTLRVLGSCRHDGTLLRPTHILYMFEKMAKREFELLHAHRKQLILAEI
jgi:radical SAM-linked protein